MKESLIRLIKNINHLQKLPLKRYNWEIEMAVLNLDCEIGEFIRKYENRKIKIPNNQLKNNKKIETKYYSKRIFPN